MVFEISLYLSSVCVRACVFVKALHGFDLEQ